MAMAELLTFYDDDQSNNFIDCTVCDRRIRGDTQYKVHLTTFQHLKKEEALAAKGLIPMPQPLPEWTDIKQFLKFLNLDEPIIGLRALAQEEDVVLEDGRIQLRYRCRMCGVEMDMWTMVSHIVSRKHRMKYLQLKRPDLVPQSSDSVQKQPGLVARVKAALVEKQEGWGTPVALSCPSWGNRLKKGSQGHGSTEDSHSSTYERAYSGRKRSEQSPLPEDSYRRSYLDDGLGRPSHSRENVLYDQSRDNATLLQSYPEDERSEMTYQDNRKRPYQDNERPYLKGDVDLRPFLEGDRSGRRHTDTSQERGYRSEHQDKCYTEKNPTRGWNSSGDAQDLYHGSITRNRFADQERSGSVRPPEEYQGDRQFQVQMYTSYEGRGKDMDEKQSQGRGFQYTERRREHVQDMEGTAMSMSFETQGYTQRHTDYLGDYAQQTVPAKRKRKSRFTDATPFEVSVTQNRLTETIVHKNNPVGAVSSRSQVSENRLDSDLMHASLNAENVMNMLDDVKIENMEEAYFMKEKLCALLKEFHAKKVQSAERKTQVTQRVKDYHHGNDLWMDHNTDMQEAKQLNDRGFQETTRYERGPRDSQQSRYFEDHRHLQDTRGYDKDPFQESEKSDSRRRDFENNPTIYQKARLEDGTRDFQHDQRLGDGNTNFRQTRGFENSPKDFQRGGHFQSGPLGMQKARNFEENSKRVHVEGTPRSFQNVRLSRGTEEQRGHKEYARGRADGDGMYSKSDLRPSQSGLDSRRDFEWHPKRGGSAEKSKDFKGYTPGEDRRAYQEGRWKSGVELYDPFHPSSSPPKAPPSSLEKLASTLLELVARKSN